MNFSQQSITTGKPQTELERQHNDLQIKIKNLDNARKEELERLFGKGELQVLNNGRRQTT